MPRALSILLTLTIAAFAGPLHAEVGPPPEHRFALEVLGGSDGIHGSDNDLFDLGLRVLYHFRGPWALEAEAIQQDGHRIDADRFELSLRRALVRNERVDFYALGGVGHAETETTLRYVVDDMPITNHFEESGFTAHLGLGVDIEVTDRWYVRPEVRRRWQEEASSFDSFSTESSLAVGFRF